MNLKATKIILAACCIAMLSIACRKTSPGCNDIDITVVSTNSDPCNGTGSINVTVPTGLGFQYSINGTFQPSPVFNKLLPGTYNISVKQANGCTNSTKAIVNTIEAGSLYNNVKSLLVTNCVSCHGGTNPQAGISFMRDCDIINNWDRIDARAVKGNPSPMPQGGLLPLSERNKIIAWINAGHRFND